MSRSNTIGAIILGAAVGVALLKFYNMPENEREEFYSHLKNRAHNLLDDIEGTMDTVKQHFAEIDTKPKEEWLEKFLVVKRLLGNLFGSDRRFLI
jgi:hypothetical protein